MIESDNKTGTFDIFCDFCDEYESFDTNGDFNAFIKEAKELGWTTIKEKDVWIHRCPMCSE